MKIWITQQLLWTREYISHGDIVNYRALLTSKENDKPISKEIEVSIYDGNENKVYSENTTSSDYGIISGSFSLASEVNSGLYKLVVKSNDNETIKQFKVNPYVTPKYEVQINYDKENYIVGEKAKIEFNAKYFFGEAVQNADFTVYVNNEEYKNLKSDSNGIASIEYYVNEAKTYNIKVEAVDSSNYYVEQTSSFTAGTDIFEVQMLPEYGKLVAGEKNDVYVFTNKADGTPVKTYITVSSKSFTKQIATDENGIGKFSIDIDQLNNTAEYNIDYKKIFDVKSNYKYNDTKKQFSVVAEDVDKNKVNKTITLDVEKKNLLLSTNKVKYEQGEDIKINISSINENGKNIYFFKNDKLVKMLSTDLSDTTVNLDDTYGLIDIYVTDNLNKSNTYKRTIFIKPFKKLNINISTDKQEYTPGEKIAITFNAEDENKTGVDAALMVSMIDNAILSLANNDLSIDNIKLALQDIEFSNDLDGATLYSCIVNDKSEQAIMALLLKQKSKDINISETRMYNTENKEKFAKTSIISIVILVIMLIIFLYIRYENIRKLIKSIISFIMFDLIILLIAKFMKEEIFWNYDYSLLTFGIITVLGLSVYIKFAKKIEKIISRTSISILIAFVLIYIVHFLVSVMNVSPQILLFIFAVVVLILTIIFKFIKVKDNKNTKAIKKELGYILRFILAIVVSLVIAKVLSELIQISETIIPICFIITFIFNYLFNINGEDEKEQKILEGTTISLTKYILIVLATIGGITVLYFMMMNLQTGANTAMIKQEIDRSDTNWSRKEVLDITESNSEESLPKNKKSSILNEPKDLLPSMEEKTTSEGMQESENIEMEQKNITTDEYVRNVFLESMCFIPELITTNGNAIANMKLSDNITTWTIQTVGNTKDGRIGYGILDNVKVFKDFFVDFELPKNLIEKDKVSIPVTVYNYTENRINTVLTIKQEDWFTIENNNIQISVDANSTNMVYVPISVLKAGNNKFRVQLSGNSLTDIVEKECKVSTKGYKIEKVVSTGTLDKDITEDILVLDEIIENTAKAKVKIYPSTMSQTVEGMENIFRMPTGCFEQISSSLYPNILALRYLQESGIVDDEIKEKALSYISSGYQKLLTYEVKGESGGYSLYGDSPAETVLTAYGLMEITDLSNVYNVDNNVIEKMTKYLYSKQNINGTFTITGSHLGGANSDETLSLNAYITWALSESNPTDSRLNKSVEYLKGKIDKINDNYTLALIANILANVKDKEMNNVLKRLVNNINVEDNKAYITSNIVDYYGTRSNIQNVQTVALTSMALSKGSYNSEMNKLLINYLISRKDAYGTWHSTQATILALKALNERNIKDKLENQTILVKVNSNEQKIEIKENTLDLYELTFENLSKENKLSIDIEKGHAYYEVIEEYYIPFEKVDTKDDQIEVSLDCNNNLKVNDLLKSNIKATNKSGNTISNGMITIAIPQGFTVNEESLLLLESKGIIEKYETSYTSINIYLKNLDIGQIVNLDVSFRANYPVEITGMSLRAYDYYNPEIEGKTVPIEITVKK